MSFLHMCDCNNIGHNVHCHQDISWTWDLTWASLHAGDTDIVHQVHRHNLACRWQLLNMDEAAPLWQDLPAIGGWWPGSPRLDHIKHLILMHEGEIREAFGEWVWIDGIAPSRLQDPRAHHVQFSKHRGQFLAYQGLGAAEGDKTWEPAIGGNEDKINRVLWYDRRGGFHFRKCRGFALAELLLAFGSRFSASHLWQPASGTRPQGDGVGHVRSASAGRIACPWRPC